MTYDDMVMKPTSTSDGVKLLRPVNHKQLLLELSPYIEMLGTEKRQLGLRWADNFEGVGDLRDPNFNPKQYGSSDFHIWQPNTEYLQELAKEIGIKECGRVRLLLMQPQTCYTFHHDPDGYRVHIPLWTHPNAFFLVNGKMWHMELGNAYLMKVLHLHTAINAGRETRLHIVFDKCDYLA